LDRVRAAPIGSPERSALLAGLFGPSWRERVGPDALRAGFENWNRSLSESRIASSRATRTRSPEREALDALVPAWEHGLTNIVTIPCRGEYTRRIGPHTLMVTSPTRDDTKRYTAALNSFAQL
jgi:hypothetical protein